jgi:hypothetical protein
MSTSSGDRDAFEQLAEEFAERLRRGEHPSLSEYIARCPDRAEDIRKLFPALALVERFKPSGDGAAIPFASSGRPAVADLPERLGDYRILRYLGEGGMGVVYEAVRESLRSHVALKVMHPQYRNRENYLRRFRTEARSAARLHHTNIVSVFDYGVQDGVCFYAMQYIAGHSLDKVVEDIRQLRRENEGTPAAPDNVAPLRDDGSGPLERDDLQREVSPAPKGLRNTATLGLLTGRYATKSPAEDSENEGSSLLHRTPEPAVDGSEKADSIAMDAALLAQGFESTIIAESELTVPGPEESGVDQDAAPAGMAVPHDRQPATPDPGAPREDPSEVSSSSLTGRTDDRYYREVARLGVQVAEALAYAHDRRVIHRDIKPPNLILDPLGNVWITDFGLAKFEDGDDLSQSHYLIGTLRYMAPERFRGASSPGATSTHSGRRSTR